MRITIVIFPGVEEMDFVAPYEVFSVSKLLGGDVSISLTALQQGGQIRAFHGLEISSFDTLREEDHYDLIVIPGGAWLSGENTGVRRVVAEGQLPKMLRARSDRGTVLASICTGAFVLAEAGLLAGRHATTHHQAQTNLLEYGIKLTRSRVVDDGNIITAGGVTSGLDLSLWIVERFFGADLARRVESYLEYEPSEPVFKTTDQ